MGDDIMQDFISSYSDDFNENDPSLRKPEGEEENIVAENIEDVEATPFIPDDDYKRRDYELLRNNYNNFSKEMKDVVDNYLHQHNVIHALKYEIDNNKIIIQDLKGSVVSLKVSTTRIEDEVKDLSKDIMKLSKEKKLLDSSLVDLDFRFNELITRQEETDLKQSNQHVKNDVADTMQSDIKEVVNAMESKISSLDERIASIDDQNKRITKLKEDIRIHEEHVKDIQQTLNYHADDLTKLDSLSKRTASVLEEKSSNSVNGCKDFTLQSKVDEFIAKTEMNEQSIANAWVGLIAALLLIPIAFFMGKFM